MTYDAPAVNYVCEVGALCSVVQETAIHGWPHQSTARERREVTTAVLVRYVLGMSGTVLCRFGRVMGPVKCGIVWRDKGKVRARFRVDVRVFEDGSYVTFGRPVRAKVRKHG